MTPRIGPLFDGATFDPAQDGERLETALDKTRRLMRTGRWWTLAELAQAVGCSEAGVSARVRDLKKPKFGGHTMETKRVSGGLFMYRMVR